MDRSKLAAMATAAATRAGTVNLPSSGEDKGAVGAAEETRPTVS
jgi:hypothetical protein